MAGGTLAWRAASAWHRESAMSEAMNALGVIMMGAALKERAGTITQME